MSLVTLPTAARTPDLVRAAALFCLSLIACLSSVTALAAEVALDRPFVPLWWTDNVAVHSRRLRGFVPSPSGDLRGLAAAWWESGTSPRQGDAS